MAMQNTMTTSGPGYMGGKAKASAMKSPKYNVPNQGNHQTQGGMKTAPTMPQITTPGIKPVGGVTSQPTQVQTNMADKTSQAVTRQVKANYGTSIGIGSGKQQGAVNNMLTKSGFNTPKDNSYQNMHERNAIATQGVIGKVGGAIKNTFKSIFSDNSQIGSGLTPQMLFQDMKVGKPTEVYTDDGLTDRLDADYVGYQKGYINKKGIEELPGFHLYNLKKDYAQYGLVKGSTVSEDKLKQHNLRYTLPPTQQYSKNVEGACNNRKGKMLVTSQK